VDASHEGLEQFRRTLPRVPAHGQRGRPDEARRRASDALGDFRVEIVGGDASDVVCLEDLRH